MPEKFAKWFKTKITSRKQITIIMKSRIENEDEVSFGPEIFSEFGSKMTFMTSVWFERKL